MPFTKPNGENITGADIDNLSNAFQPLYEALQTAYWDATDIDTKDRIMGVQEVVSDILSELNETAVENDDAALNEIKSSIGSIQQRLDALKTEIDTIIHNVSTASEVATAIDKAITTAASLGLLA